MNHLSLYAGVGAMTLAAQRAGMTEVALCDAEPFCRQVLAKRFPGVPIFDYDTDVTVAALAAVGVTEVDVISGGFPCFPAGTLVLTVGGYKPIEQVAIGELVLTHRGRWRAVTAVMAKTQAPLVAVTAQGSPGVLSTPEHPFYSRGEGGPEWTDASRLSLNSKVAQVVPDTDPASTQSKPPAFWRLVGRYLADGWRVRRTNRLTGGRVVVCAGYQKAEALAGIIAAAGFHSTRVDERTVVKFHICSTELFNWLEPFGVGASGKHMPGWVLGLPDEEAKALLDGYISGDGHIEQRTGNIRVTTTSRALALGVGLLVQRVFGVVAHFRSVTPPVWKTIEGRQVAQRPYYTVNIPHSNRGDSIEGNLGWKSVRSVTDAGVGNVYNLAVAEDESYVVENYVVHNCQPHSLAGQRKGAADERNRWPEMARIIRDFRPTWVLGENVRGMVSNGFLDTVCADLEALGYEVRPFVLPTGAASGSPHLRERVFVVAHSGSRQRERSFGEVRAGRNAPDGRSFEQLAARERFRLETLADTQRVGRNGWAGSVGQAYRWGEPENSGYGMANTRSAGLAQRSELGHNSGSECSTVERNGLPREREVGATQPGLGRNVNGFPDWLDRPAMRWPAGRGEQQYGWEPPRLTTRRDFRRDRIKALGNSAVWQTLYPFFRAMVLAGC